MVAEKPTGPEDPHAQGPFFRIVLARPAGASCLTAFLCLTVVCAVQAEPN
jgi:hypothetical protein